MVDLGGYGPEERLGLDLDCHFYYYVLPSVLISLIWINFVWFGY